MNRKRYFAFLRSHENQEKQSKKQLHDLICFIRSQQQKVYTTAIQEVWHSRSFEHSVCPPD
eukprot:11599178-Prorocentrum_lima.AAC.1